MAMHKNIIEPPDFLRRRALPDQETMPSEQAENIPERELSVQVMDI